MKKQAVILLILLMAFGWGAASAIAAPYVSGNLGAVWVDDSDLNAGGGKAELSFDTGFGVTAAVGHAYDNGLRAEVELGYRTSDLNEISVSGLGSGSINGDVSTFSMMINGFYDFMPGETVSPFIGAGIGYANVEADLDDFGSEDDNVFAYQGAAGVAFAVSKNLKLDVQYRYFATDDPDFNGADAEYGTHNAMLGMRVSF